MSVALFSTFIFLLIAFNSSLAINTTTTTKAPKLKINLTTPTPPTKLNEDLKLGQNGTEPSPLQLSTSTELPKLLLNFSTEASKVIDSEKFTKVISTQNPEAVIKTNSSISSSEFLIPSAIRVIPDGGIEMLYPQEISKQEIPKQKVDDIEETFTYQVKRQTRDGFSGKAFAFKSPWEGIFRNNGQSANENRPGETALTNKQIEEMNNKIQQLEEKVLKSVAYISELEKRQNSTFGDNNSTFEDVKIQLKRLNESVDSQKISTQEMHRTFSIQQNHLERQIQTLTMHLRHLQNQTSEQNILGTKNLEHVLSAVQNTTHEIRLNEVRTRYNQKALTTLDRSVQVNNEKIAEMSASEAGPKWIEQTTGCGGILIAEEGVISYKFRQPYLNDERCIWTIRANRRSRIVLQLLEDGFQNSSNSDYITVTEFVDDQPSSLVTSSRIENGNRAIHTFRGPLIFLTFYSDSEIPGNGFTLKFKGAGNISLADVPNAIRYRHYHLKEAIGHLTYPDEKNLLYQPNEVTTFVINPPSTSTKVYLRYTDLEKEENCEYDSVNFYGSVMGSFALTKKYCAQQEVYSGESLQSSDGWIIVFRSDASSQYKGIQFSWEPL